MRLLILGHDGMLGTDVMTAFKDVDPSGISIGDVDITVYYDLCKEIRSIAPEVIINCAAYTNVDGCETNVDTAYNVNAEGAKNVALVCKDVGARLIHISTDYVFDGLKTFPYKEDDPTGPISVYGASKLKGEEYIKDIIDNYLIVRTQWLYGKAGKNFVNTMLKLSETHDTLSVVDDQNGSPTYTKDLAHILKVMVDKRLSGTYHVSNGGFTSWYDFSKMIFELTKKDIDVKRISSEDFKRPARRPSSSVFNLCKLVNDTGVDVPDWDDALYRYLKETNLI